MEPSSSSSASLRWHFAAETLRPVPAPARERFGHCGVFVDPHYFIVVGGQTTPRVVQPGNPPKVAPSELFGDLAAFNVDSREWIVTQAPEAFPNSARSFAASAVLGDRVFFFFGRKLPYTALNDAAVMTSSAEHGIRWDSVNRSGMPVTPRWGHSAVAFQESKRILLFGGKQSSELFSDELLVYDAETDRYMTVAQPNATSMNPMWPSARGHHCAVAVDPNTMVVFGGRGPPIDMHDRRRTVWMFDLRSGKWNRLQLQGHFANHVTDRFGASACWTNVHNGSIAVIGGRHDSCDDINTGASLRPLDASSSTASGVVDEPPSWLFFNGHGFVDAMQPAQGSHNFNSMALLYPTASYLPNAGGPHGSFLMWGGFDWRRSTCMINSHFSVLQVSDRPALLPVATAPAPMQRVPTAPIVVGNQAPPGVLRPKFDPKTVEILQPLELRAATLALGTSVSLRPSGVGGGLSDDRPAMKKVASIDPSLLATESTAQDRPVAKRIIGELLRSSTDPRLGLQQRRASRPQGKQYDEWIFAKPEELLELCDQAISILENEPTVLRLNAPCKVFGDIHGQLSDLLLLFATFGAPTHHGGDIQLCNYLFLGDYVDRGSHSMEVITLLLALKVTYPDRIFLLRGNHEARQVNSKYTFMAECNERLGYYHGAEVWERFNKVFDYLSLAAIIGGRVFCVHGGLGPDTVSIREIESLSKPISYVEPPFSAQMPPQFVRMNRMLMQLLWCDPADNDSTVGTFADNPLRTGGNPSLGIFKFTSHVVNQFCAANDVDMILRGHQVVPEGLEVFASGRLLTVFSATNYCGVMKNNGAIVLINDRLIISAKTIKCRDADDSQDWVDASMQPPPSPPAWYT